MSLTESDHKKGEGDLEFIDFHTHNLTGEAYPLAIASYSLPKIGRCPKGQYYSVGLHPWDTARLDAYRVVDQALPHYLENEHCLALGEIGLDRLRGASLAVQEELLSVQLKIGENLHKPVIVHCVRAWSELLSVFRKQRFTYNKAIHGYRGSLPVLDRLVEEGWYISAGFYTPPELITHIPLNQLLLESDDTNLPITTLYEQTALLLKLSPDELQAIVKGNIQRFIRLGE